MLLTILYWVLLVLALIGAFAPGDWAYWPRLSNLVLIILLVIIGLKIFKTPLS